MAVIGNTWVTTSWVSGGGWKLNTWGDAQPPPLDISDVCLEAFRTGIVSLTASTDHGRQCEGVGMSCTALNQVVQIPPGGTQTWTFTLPAAQVPTGATGIQDWEIQVGFRRTNNGEATLVELATVTVDGLKDVTDAEFEITLDADDLTGFTFGSFWYWNAWRTDSGEEEVLAGARLMGMNVVTIPPP
jgi:hypothetical protein